jgi:hypothetical protein
MVTRCDDWDKIPVIGVVVRGRHNFLQYSRHIFIRS